MADRSTAREHKGTRRGARPVLGPVLRVERLDDRITPATWDGDAALGGNFNWSEPTNWVGDVAPLEGEDLIFPRIVDNKGVEQSGNILTTFNDYPDGTQFGNVTINSSNYELRGGNRIVVTGGLFSVDLSNVNKLNGDVKVFIPLEFGPSSTIQYQGSTAAGGDRNVTFLNPTTSVFFADDMTLNVVRGSGTINEGLYFGQAGGGGTIVGTGPGRLLKIGSGGVTFRSSDPNVYAGYTKVQAGTLSLASGATDAGVPADLIIEGATALVELDGADQIPDTALVSIDKNATLNMRSFSETIGSLFLASGTIQGSGALTLTQSLDVSQITNIATIQPLLDVSELLAPGTDEFVINGAGVGQNPTPRLDLNSIRTRDNTTITFQGGFTRLTNAAFAGSTFKTNIVGGKIQVDSTNTDSPSLPGNVSIGQDARLELLAGDGVEDNSVVSLTANAVLQVGASDRPVITLANPFPAGGFQEKFQALASDSPATQVIIASNGRSRGDHSLVLTPRGYFSYQGLISGEGRVLVNAQVGGGVETDVQGFRGPITLEYNTNTYVNNPIDEQPIQVAGRIDIQPGEGTGQQGVTGVDSTGVVYGTNPVGTLTSTAALNSKIAPGTSSPNPNFANVVDVTPGTLTVNNLLLDGGQLFIRIDSPTAYGQLAVIGQFLKANKAIPVDPATATFKGTLNVALSATYATDSFPGAAFTIVDVQRPDIDLPTTKLLTDLRSGAALGEFALFNVPDANGILYPFRITYIGGAAGNDVVLLDARPPIVAFSRAADQPATSSATTANFTAEFTGVVSALDASKFVFQTTGTLRYTSAVWTKVTGPDPNKSYFTVTVRGLTGSGRLTGSLAAAAGFSAAVIGSLPSTNTNNTVDVNVPTTGGGGQTGGTDPFLTAARMLVGTDAGGGGLVNVYQGQSFPASQIILPNAAFAGGVRVASGDFNRDGIRDFVYATGPGFPTFLQVVNGKTGEEMFQVAPFEGTYTGGLNVSTGDVTGDGTPDLIVSPDEGGGPRVVIFNGAGFGVIADFFGIEDPAFRGGARTAVGDVNGDGIGDVIVAAGFGGGPRVAVYNGASLGTGRPVKVTADFFAFEPNLRNGAYVASLDINNDGFAEVVASGGPGGGPRVTAYNGKSLLSGALVPIVNFFAGDPNSRAGIRIATADFDGDNAIELVTGAGPGDGSRVQVFRPADLRLLTPPPIASFDAFPDFTGGVFVG